MGSIHDRIEHNTMYRQEGKLAAGEARVAERERARLLQRDQPRPFSDPVPGFK